MPSLHLSLCDDYFRLGDFARSGEHLEAARSCIGVLADDGYGKMIRSGFVRLEKKLAARGG